MLELNSIEVDSISGGGEVIDKIGYAIGYGIGWAITAPGRLGSAIGIGLYDLTH